MRNLSAGFLGWDKSAVCCCGDCCCCCNKEFPLSCFWIPRPANNLALSIVDPPIDCARLPDWWNCCNQGVCEELKLGDWRPELEVAVGVLRGSCPSWDGGFCTAAFDERTEPMVPTASSPPEGPSTVPVKGWGGNDGSWDVGVAGVGGRDDVGMLSPVSASS